MSHRLARRRAREVDALSRVARVGSALQSRAVWRVDVEANVAEFRAPGAVPVRGRLSRKLRADVAQLAALPPPEAPEALIPAQTALDAEPRLQDLPRLLRRLRRLPLRFLAPQLPLLAKQVEELPGEPKARLWNAVARRVLVNSGVFPVQVLAYALPELQRAGHLAKVSALGKLVRGLARQPLASTSSTLPMLKCCRVLQLQLAQSKPTAPGLWAERVHQMLSRRLPSRFAQAPAAEVLPWMDFYAEQGLVDGQHLQVWEKAGASLREAFLSQEEERQLRELQDKVPLWVGECLPHPPANDAVATWQPPLDEGDLPVDDTMPMPGTLEPVPKNVDPSLLPPMYQMSPPVPVLWHTAPENYERKLSRLGPRQLVLALRYVAADGAGMVSAASVADVPAQHAMTELSRGVMPRRHRSRTKAQAFVGALLSHLVSRIRSVRSNEACSAVKSLAALKRLGLASHDASEALQALISGPLSGWKVATALTPRDVALLLQGMSALAVEDGEVSPVTLTARAALDTAAARLLDLATCALQEAGAPPGALRTLCGAAAHAAEFGGRPARRALRRFLVAAAAAARDGPHVSAPVLRQPLAVLRAAGDAKVWSSDAFEMLAPMVTELIFGRAVRKLPGFERDWKPLLPRHDHIQGAWRIEELAEVAWLYARSSSQRPLEGQTATALSLTLLIHLPALQSALGEEVSDQAVLDSRLLAFASDASRILRSAADTPFFEPWVRPVKFPGHESQLSPSSDHFDPQLLADGSAARQLLLRWRKLTSAPAAGARRRSRALASDASLGRDALAACTALALLRSEIAGHAISCLLRASSKQLASSELRLWLRQFRQHRAAKKEATDREAHAGRSLEHVRSFPHKDAFDKILIP
ncbi:unnamed protein product [Effrenium voratum]|uniref:Uncharacterized protein n=1 Tax=Effrenium voratum TaxID=2562239 RepID=A0AA36NHB6_9DINO|nr:unnamed protein product [Effrenium voratum]